ncbi:MAG: GAF domain-containing protein [Deltaproteobacteria bacterium]|jgi:signal transduction histidine kinase|nr:GAF domain-containing protein [Deltaproteobacteria bacterium]
MLQGAPGRDTAAFIAELTRLANSGLDLGATAGGFLELLSSELSLDRALLLLQDPADGTLSVFGKTGKKPGGPDASGDPDAPPPSHVPAKGPFWGRAATGPGPRVADEDDLRGLPGDWARFLAPYLTGVAAVPVTDGRDSYGAILAMSKGPIGLSGLQDGRADAVAGQLALAIRCERLASDARFGTAAFFAKLVGIADSGQSFEAKADGMLELLARELSLDGALLFLLDRESRTLSLHAADKRDRGKGPSPGGPPGSTLPVKGAFLERALSGRQPLPAGEGDLKDLPPEWAGFLAPYLPGLGIAPVTVDKVCCGIVATLSASSSGRLSGFRGQAADAVAGQLARALKDSRLATDTRKSIAAFFAKLIRLANSNIRFESKVENFLNLLTWELSLDKSLLFFLDRESRTLTVHKERSQDPDGRPVSPVPVRGTFLDRAISTHQSLLADEGDMRELPPEWAAFLKPFLPSLAIVPVLDDKTCYGIIMTLSKKPIDHSVGSYGQVVDAVANQLALAVKNNQLATDTRKRISVLHVLSELGRQLAETIDVNAVMQLIPNIAKSVFFADGCALNVIGIDESRPGDEFKLRQPDEENKILLFSSSAGVVPPGYNFFRYQNLNISYNLTKPLMRTELFSGRLADDPMGPELTVKERESTILTMPLMFQGQLSGNIAMFNKLGGSRGGALAEAPKPFEAGDIELIKAMNSMISGAVENSLTFRKVETLANENQMMVRYLSSLYEISGAMMTTVRYDELIWIIVRALTLPQGLDFDKVLILLLRDTDGGSKLVSSAYWAPENKSRGDADTSLAELLKKPSRTEAAQMMEAGKKLDISIPVTPDATRLLARVAVEKKPLLGFRGLDTYDDRDLLDFGIKAYAAVPMLAKGREVGVIAVDRSISGEPLTQESLRDLNMLANQAGLAIENTHLYEDLRNANQSLSQVRMRLIEAEKLAAQGEMGTQLAHEIRNPLVSIGGFTQRLLKKMPEDDELRRYPLVILEEVERLNKVLNNVLDFSRDEKGRVREFDLGDVAREVLASLKHELQRNKVDVSSDIEENLPPVSGDDQQIMHVFLNLMYNASQAMTAQGGGQIWLKIFRHQEGENNCVACRITDTGPGIPDELLNSVFNPFFTTKAQGTGLGLSIVQKIVARYNGVITVTNHPPEYPGSGASFTFMFPVIPPAAPSASNGGGILRF